ncbi:hypothetical protein CVT24_008215 [Panaeolus cyanescens]|uniref:Phosphatidylinositol-specific phospholipase C X domain-containing protein n=1 Tax=Panaeolus cyanescens TaxID=181874 RepID=A0A409VF23_9AGAR|nr:hypothetical protein CVT24_008215 [Panaeolus cyanescens]
MPPDHCRKWMQMHRHIFGGEPLTMLCMPASHDAGTYRRGYHTTFGTESNVLTQTRSIFDQLELGVRYFDIRPHLTSPEPNAGPGNWACGHYTGEAKAALGWQGANCMEIREVVDELNRFTQDNAELIFVEITHIHRIFINNPISSTERAANDDEWNSLLHELSGIRNLFTLDRAGGPSSLHQQMHHRHLNDFIGNGQAAVVVLVEDYPARTENLTDRGFWPIKMQDGHTYRVPLPGSSVTREQAPGQAFFSTIDPLQIFGPHMNGNSVLYLAREAQDEKFPWLLQELAADGYPSYIWMDRIQDADLLTFCLATGYHKFNRAKGLKNMVIVYGGFLVTSPDVHNRVRHAIDNAKDFKVTNHDLGVDPWPGMGKSCAAYYEQDGIVKGKFARENQFLNFAFDVVSIEYGNQRIRDQKVFFNVLKAVSRRDRFRVDNSSMGCDPQPGVRKKCVVRFRNSNNSNIREDSAQEGKDMDFKTWMERLV